MIRLQKYMAMCGVASRRAAEKMIAEGRVSVNGAVVTEMGTQIEEGTDVVRVDGAVITGPDDLEAVLFGCEVGQTVEVIIARNGQYYQVSLPLIEEKN